MTASLRSGSELIKATRVYGQEDAPTTWRLFAVTTLVSVGAFLAALLPLGTVHPWLEPLRWLASAVLGLTIVRVFIFFHDAMHGAIFRKSKLGDVFMWIHGALVLTPSRVWKDSHNYHHAHTSKLVGSQIGSFPILTKRMYLAATPTQRFLYRFTRHWATICLGYVFMFLIGMCLQPMFKQPKRYAVEVLAVLTVHFGLMAAITYVFGVEAMVLSFLAPAMIACAAGSYLFYAQHTFEGAEIRDRRSWEFTAAALRSSSMIDMSPAMHWFTGLIGYHHVHHLNSMIPFYRLPEAMAGVPELQNPARTSLAWRDIMTCLRLHLWDPEQGKMVGFDALTAVPPSDAEDLGGAVAPR